MRYLCGRCAARVEADASVAAFHCPHCRAEPRPETVPVTAVAAEYGDPAPHALRDLTFTSIALAVAALVLALSGIPRGDDELDPQGFRVLGLLVAGAAVGVSAFDVARQGIDRLHVDWRRRYAPLLALGGAVLVALFALVAAWAA